MADRFSDFIGGEDYFTLDTDDESLLDPDVGTEFESVLLGIGMFVVFAVVLIGGLLLLEFGHDSASHATPSAPAFTSVSHAPPDPPCYPFQRNCPAKVSDI